MADSTDSFSHLILDAEIKYKVILFFLENSSTKLLSADTNVTLYLELIQDIRLIFPAERI